MNIYKVTAIREQDFGCEEPPVNVEYSVDVILSDTETNKKITISVPDAKLYADHIDVGSLVTYDGSTLSLFDNINN